MISTAAFTKLQSMVENGRSEDARDLLLRLEAGCLALEEEIRHLRLRVSGLEGLLSPDARAVEEGGLVWMAAGGEKKGPFCPLCHGADRSLIRMVADPEDWVCPSCGTRLSRRKEGRAPAVIPFRETCRRLGI